MNIRLMCFVFMSVVAMPLTLAFAQITIFQSDVNRIFQAGNSVVNRNDTITTSLDVGHPGANTWNFTGVRTSTFQAYASVVASGTPWFSFFPTATNAFRVDTSFYGVNGTIYQYLQLTPTAMRNLGNMAQQSVVIGTLVLRTTVTPPETVYVLPATLNTTWHTAFSNNVRITLGGTELSNTTTTHNATYTVDGYGTMRLPGSSQSIYSLRLRKLNYYNGSPVVSFIFLSRGGAQLMCEATDTSARSGTITVRRGTVVWNNSIVSDSLTDVRMNEGVLSGFVLEQNYPNPFNPVTTIRYNIPTQSHVVLSVYDVLGREVKTLVNQDQAAGTYRATFDGSDIASGTYFYRLRAGSSVETKRLLLVR